MLIAVATVLHRVYTYNQTLTTTVWSGIGLTTALTVFSVWHCITDEIHMHSLLFGIMICLVGIQTRSIIHARILDQAVRKEITKVAAWGAVIFVSGFGIWNLDNAFCGLLTHTKREIGMPWSFLLELHGWWHIFTGVGAYICLFFHFIYSLQRELDFAN
jgi:dihydroceramidase